MCGAQAIAQIRRGRVTACDSDSFRLRRDQRRVESHKIVSGAEAIGRQATGHILTGRSSLIAMPVQAHSDTGAKARGTVFGD
jgi:hypothetical protein